MVQLLLEALEDEDRRAAVPAVECWHLDARFSDELQDVGRARFGKLFLAFKFALQAIWWRLRHGVDHFYYVPAPPFRTPMYRDWIVLGLCRPFFKKVIFHWHAAGMAEWLAAEGKPWQRWISGIIYGRADLSIVLRPFNRQDGDAFRSKRVEVVPNGVPDPCPKFEQELLPRRFARVAARKELLAGGTLDAAERAAAGTDAHIFRLLYISLCYRAKGLFDTIEAVALARRQLENSPVRVRLTVAGTFWLPAEKAEFEQRVRQADLQDGGEPMVEYRGFVGGADKHRLFVESDALCFPSYMSESFGLVLVEGMSFGLPLITTNFRHMPELLPPNAPGIVDPKSPDQIAAALIACLNRDYDPGLRAWFMAHYTQQKFAENMRRVLASLDDRHA